MNISTLLSQAAPAAPGMPQNQGAIGGPFLTLAPAAADSAQTQANLPSDADAAGAGLQTAASYVQVASGYLGQINGILSRMADLSDSAQDPADDAAPGAGDEFAALQGQLLAIVGGPADGSAGVSGAPTGAAFLGQALFGPSGGLTVSTGLAAMSSMTVGPTDLRQGALEELVSQDSSGAFSVGAADPGTTATLSQAIQQASAAAGAMDASRAQVDVASSAFQVGSANLASSVTSPAEAATALQNAVNAIFGQPDAAIAAQSVVSSPFLLGLLQSA